MQTSDGRRSLMRQVHQTSRSSRRESTSRWLFRSALRLTGYGVAPLAAVGLVALGMPAVAVLPFGCIAALFGFLYFSVNHEPLLPPRSETYARLLVAAPAIPPALRSQVPLVGVLAGDHELRAPASEETCLGYSMELIARNATDSGVLLKDSMISQCTLELPDGRRVRIPAGTCELHPRPVPVRELEHRRFESNYLRVLDPLLASGTKAAGKLELFPYDEVRERVVRAGDRVALHNDVRLAPDPDASRTHYRENAAILQPIDVPVLVVEDA